ncbi:MAG TPA: hypothetical protein VFC19_43460 [Candidatus Limnocylindrales bacterium]|nr:hypothetical protein [Candidatus Limnocylindrales bacterium]
MLERLRFDLVAVLLVATATAGCTSSDRVEGCTPPSNEAALLDAYAKEPAIGVQPAASQRREEPKRQPACRRVGKAVSRTSVSVQWDVRRNVNEQEIQGLYEAATIGTGWTAVPARSSVRYAQFCKSILGERSILDLSWQDAVVLQSGDLVPGVVTVVVRAAGEAEASCP